MLEINEVHQHNSLIVEYEYYYSYFSSSYNFTVSGSSDNQASSPNPVFPLMHPLISYITWSYCSHLYLGLSLGCFPFTFMFKAFFEFYLYSFIKRSHTKSFVSLCSKVFNFRFSLLFFISLGIFFSTS